MRMIAFIVLRDSNYIPRQSWGENLLSRGIYTCFCPIGSDFFLPKSILIVSYVQLVAGKTDRNFMKRCDFVMTPARNVLILMRVKLHASGG